MKFYSALRILKVMRFMEMALSSWSTFSFFYALQHGSSVFPITYGASASVSAFSFLS